MKPPISKRPAVAHRTGAKRRCVCVCVCLSVCVRFVGRKSPNKGEKPNHKHIQERRKKRKVHTANSRPGTPGLPQRPPKAARASADQRATPQTNIQAVARVSAEFGVYLQTVPQKHKRNTTKRSIRRPQGLPHNPTYKTVPPNTKTKKPAVARVSAEFGVYLTHRHTDGPTKTSKKHYQGQPERDLPQTPTCRNVFKKKMPVYKQVPQQKTQYQKAARISADPAVCLRGRHTGKSKKRQRNAAQRKQEPTKAGKSIHRPRGLPQRPTYRTVTPRGQRSAGPSLYKTL